MPPPQNSSAAARPAGVRCWSPLGFSGGQVVGRSRHLVLVLVLLVAIIPSWLNPSTSASASGDFLHLAYENSTKGNYCPELDHWPQFCSAVATINKTLTPSQINRIEWHLYAGLEDDAKKEFCEMARILEKIDCAQPYSINVYKGQCFICQLAYRDWLCSSILVTLDILPVPHCDSLCYRVMRVCPYLNPDRIQQYSPEILSVQNYLSSHPSQYGGDPAFNCPETLFPQPKSESPNYYSTTDLSLPLDTPEYSHLSCCWTFLYNSPPRSSGSSYVNEGLFPYHGSLSFDDDEEEDIVSEPPIITYKCLNKSAIILDESLDKVQEHSTTSSHYDDESDYRHSYKSQYPTAAAEDDYQYIDPDTLSPSRSRSHHSGGSGGIELDLDDDDQNYDNDEYQNDLDGTSTEDDELFSEFEDSYSHPRDFYHIVGVDRDKYINNNPSNSVVNSKIINNRSPTTTAGRGSGRHKNRRRKRSLRLSSPTSNSGSSSKKNLLSPLVIILSLVPFLYLSVFLTSNQNQSDFERHTSKSTSSSTRSHEDHLKKLTKNELKFSSSIKKKRRRKRSSRYTSKGDSASSSGDGLISIREIDRVVTVASFNCSPSIEKFLKELVSRRKRLIHRLLLRLKTFKFKSKTKCKTKTKKPKTKTKGYNNTNKITILLPLPPTWTLFSYGPSSVISTSTNTNIIVLQVQRKCYYYKTKANDVTVSHQTPYNIINDCYCELYLYYYTYCNCKKRQIEGKVTRRDLVPRKYRNRLKNEAFWGQKSVSRREVLVKALSNCCQKLFCGWWTVTCVFHLLLVLLYRIYYYYYYDKLLLLLLSIVLLNTTYHYYYYSILQLFRLIIVRVTANSTTVTTKLCLKIQRYLREIRTRTLHYNCYNYYYFYYYYYYEKNPIIYTNNNTSHSLRNVYQKLIKYYSFFTTTITTTTTKNTIDFYSNCHPTKNPRARTNSTSTCTCDCDNDLDLEFQSKIDSLNSKYSTNTNTTNSNNVAFCQWRKMSFFQVFASFR